MNKNLFIFILIYFLMLLIAKEIDANRLKSRWEVHRKSWLELRIENSFKHKINGHFLYHSLTGSPLHPNSMLSKYTSTIHLWLLFSFNFFHFHLFFGLLKNEKLKKIKKIFLFIPLFPFPAIFRIQLLFILKHFFPKNILWNFILAFLISIFCGHFFESPHGFVLSFGFIGMSQFLFFERKMDEVLFMALLLLLFSLIFKKDFSPLGFLFSIPIIFLFKKLFRSFIFIFIFCFIFKNSFFLELPFTLISKKILPFLFQLAQNSQSLATGYLAMILLIYFWHKRLSMLLLGLIFFIDFAHCPTFILR